LGSGDEKKSNEIDRKLETEEAETKKKGPS
jgi:hypothetical protein